MSRLHFVVAAAAVLGAAAPASAAQNPPPKAPAKAASPAAPAWIVDKAQSRIAFKSSFTGAPLEGAFRTWDAQINFDPKNLAASRVVVTIDVGSVTSTDAEAAEALPSRDWLDAARNPKATCTSSNFRDLGGGKYEAAGTLNLRGISQPVVLPFTLAVNGVNARMTGTANVDRSKYAIGGAQFKGAESIPFNVAVSVAVVARRR